MLVSTLLIALLALTGPDVYRWLPGLDLVVPLFADIGADGLPIPSADKLGYDRDTQRATRLYVSPAPCYTVWTWAPDPGHGAITTLIQVDGKRVALYHESGRIRIEVMPDSLLCYPAR